MTEAKREAIARLREFLERQEHQGHCHTVHLTGWSGGRMPDCDCGLDSALAAIMALAEPQVSDDTARVRSDVFAVLRRHDVGEQCFAEVASILTAAAAPASEPQALNEDRALSIMLPPGPADGEYLDGWVDGQQYLIDNAAIHFATETQKGSGE